MDDLVNRLRANTPDDLHYEAADEIARLRALVASDTPMDDQREAADALGDAIDEIHRLEAELTELRALKAKVDGCRSSRGMVIRPGDAPLGHGWMYATDLLAWLRGESS